MMYKQTAFNRKRLNKLAYGGDPNRDAIYGASSGIAQAGLNVLLPGLGNAYGAFTGMSDSLTTNADGTYKSTGAAIANYATNPLGFISDAATGNIGHKKQRQAVIDDQIAASNRNMEQGRDNLQAAIGSGYSQSGYKDVTMRKYGGSLKRYAMGAKIQNPEYEVEGEEMVEGDDVNLEGQNQIASNMHKAVGPSHEEGGVDGEGGEKVYSDRIKLSGAGLELLKSMGFKPKKKATIAEAAEFIAKKQKVFEDLKASNNPIETNTSKLMLERIEQAKELIFQDQEMQKEVDMERGSYKKGGYLRRGGFTTESGPIKRSNSPDSNPIGGESSNRDSEFNQDITATNQFSPDGGEDENKYTKYLAGIPTLVNTLGYVQNLSDINKLKTEINPVMPRTTYRNFVDRSGVGLNRIQAQLNTGLRALSTSSSRNKNAAAANMLGSSYDATNQIVNAENQRRDALENSNVDIANTSSMYRNQLVNKYELDNMNRKNELIPTKIQARNAFMDANMKQITEDRNTKFANDKMDADTEMSISEMKLMIMSNKDGVADELARSYGMEGATREELADAFIRKHLSTKKYKK